MSHDGYIIFTSILAALCVGACMIWGGRGVRLFFVGLFIFFVVSTEAVCVIAGKPIGCSRILYGF